MLDWDDLRFVLAVSREGAATGAGRRLGVDQTTVARRLARLESAIGATLFERRQDGYRLTELGERTANAAEAIEAEVLALQHSVAAATRTLTGAVRFTCSEILAAHLVTPWIAAFRKAHPEVRIEVISTDALLDLAHGEADVALRVGSAPSGAGIVARRLPPRRWSIYCGRAYATENGAPGLRDEIAGHAIIGMGGPMARLASWKWLESLVGASSVTFHSNSLGGAVANAKAGMGLAMLPCFVGDREPELIRCLPPIPELDAECWLIVSETMKSAPHVRAFADDLAQRLIADEAAPPA
jgi:DNA-binding transcriptional LysR family regulator